MNAGGEPRFAIDHVELFVPDPRAAAVWYSRVLDCKPVEGTEQWAANPGGPLMTSPDGGVTKLALFAGEPQGGRPTAGFHRVAFRVNAGEFLAFRARTTELQLVEGGAPARMVDHGEAFSLYFADPFGHRLEVTTYEAAAVRAAQRGD